MTDGPREHRAWAARLTAANGYRAADGTRLDGLVPR